MVNFYNRFIKNSAETQNILQESIPGNVKNDNREINWTPEARKAFNDFKEELAEATLLAYPLEEAHIVLQTDLSNTGSGGLLNQFVNGQLQPLGFHSKKLSNGQKSWSTYSRELLAIHKGIKHFKDQIEGRILTVYTDHYPPTHAFSQKPAKATLQHLRQLLYISLVTVQTNRKLFRSHQRRHSWPLTTVKRISIFSHNDRKIHTMDGSHTSQKHHRLRQSLAPSSTTEHHVSAFQLNQRLGITHMRTTAYHLQLNGMIERFHRVLKGAVKCKNSTNWAKELPLFLRCMYCH